MGKPVHIAITRRVRKERVGDFEVALADFARRSLAEAGARGVHILYPAEDAEICEYGILRTFASAAHRDAFYRSEIYREWERIVAPLVEGEPEFRELDGLEAWFRDSHGPLPPRWKMALLTWVAVWPVSMLVPAIIAPLLGSSFSPTLAAGIIAAGIVVILTWVAMPVLVKVAHGWLHPKPHPHRP